MKNKDINYSTPKEVEAKVDKLLSPQERNKYNMIVKHLKKDK